MSENRMREALEDGIELIESAYAYVSHGGPTRADAEKWLTKARAALASSSGAGVQVTGEQLRESFREWWDKQVGAESATAYQRIQQAFYAGAALSRQSQPPAKGQCHSLGACLCCYGTEKAHSTVTAHCQFCERPLSKSVEKGRKGDSATEQAQSILKPHWPVVRNMDENEARQKEVQRIAEVIRAAEQRGVEKGLEMLSQHEIRMFAPEGPISGKDGTYTVAFLGCSCGWNKDGKSDLTSWAEHIRALAKPASAAEERK